MIEFLIVRVGIRVTARGWAWDLVFISVTGRPNVLERRPCSIFCMSTLLRSTYRV